MGDALRSFLGHPAVYWTWAALVVISLAVLVIDLVRKNRGLGMLMKVVWLLTTLYAGPFGLSAYWFAGRAQISQDSLWRRATRSDAHCFSGCGAGEVIGVAITVGVLALGQLWVSLVTFTLAYILGYALTVGPLVQEGVPMRRALKDALVSETASITVMEVAAIAVDLWLGGRARLGQPVFWMALAFSLNVGFAAAYLVNAALVHWGVKEGMQDPRETAAA